MRFQTSWIISSLLLLTASHLTLGMPNDGRLEYKRQNEEDASPASTTSPPRRTTSAQPDREETSAQSDREEPTVTRSVRTSSGAPTRTSSSTRRGTTFVDPRSPPGGVVIQTPITTSGSQYYKIGDPITFGWNYTSLIVSPTAVNVEAVCSDNSQTYTIAQNISAAKPTVVWDTGSYTPENDQPGLAMGIYTLVIYDEQSDVTAAPSPGRLQAFNGLKFGMYTPKPYKDNDQFECPTCEKNAGASLDVVALRMLIVTTSIISASFLLFIGTIA